MISEVPWLIPGILGVLIGASLLSTAFGTVSGQIPDEAERSFEETAERIEDFCNNRNAASSNRLIEVPERGNITIEDETMTGYGGQNSNGGLQRLGPRELDCSYVEVEGSDSTLVEGRMRTLTTIDGTEQASIRIE